MASAPRLTLRRCLEDPNLLGSALAGDSRFAWRTFLIAANGEPLISDAENEKFFELTQRPPPLQRCEEVAVVGGRRGGKSSAIAAQGIYSAISSDHQTKTARGERPQVLIISVDQRQARLVLNYIIGIVDAVPMLAAMVESRTADMLSLSNGVDIVVRAASWRSTRGPTYLAVIADEIAYFYSDDGRSVVTDSEILNALRPGLATLGGQLFMISSPYAKRGELYDTYKRNFGPNGDPLILVAKASSRALNPSLSQKVVDRAYELDPVAASAEFGGEFRSDLESFISREAVEACVTPRVFERAPISGIKFFAGVDAAGGSGGDSMTLGIAHFEKDKGAVLDCVREVLSPFSPAAATTQFASVLKYYGLHKVTGDRYAGDWPAEEFQKNGITYVPSELNRSEIYGEMLPLLNSGRIDLLDDRKLIDQICSLERKTRSIGKDSIDHPPNGHDDRANAAALALVLASTRKAPMVFSEEFLKASAIPTRFGRARPQAYAN
jgi:hypothetical protein